METSSLVMSYVAYLRTGNDSTAMPNSIQHAIAIANSDEVVRDSFNVLLTGAGYPVCTFPSGAALLDALHFFEPSVLLLDTQLPDFSVPSLIRDIVAATGRKLPTIVMANHANELPNLDQLLCDAGSLLFKPIEEHQLFAAIDKALDAMGLNPISPK